MGSWAGGCFAPHSSAMQDERTRELLSLACLCWLIYLCIYILPATLEIQIFVAGLTGPLQSVAHTSKNGFSAFFVDRKSSFYLVFEHIQGRTAYRAPPKHRTKTPPTRFRLLQNLQNLHFTMCSSTSRTCTPLKHRTKTSPRPQNDRFWCLRNRLYRGGPLPRPKHGSF